MTLKQKIKKYIITDPNFKYLYFATLSSRIRFINMQRRADKENVIKHYYNMRHGSIENKTENRMVLHHLLRESSDRTYKRDARKSFMFYVKQRKKCFEFADKLRSNSIVSPSGLPYKNFVQIGVGGSILGAKFLHNAFADCCSKPRPEYKAIFISNIDKETIIRRLDEIDLKESLFIYATKSGKTKEIEICRKIINEYISSKYPELDIKKQSVLITSITSPEAFSEDYAEKFYIDNNIGGRFSISSAMGLLINSIIYGEEVCCQFLDGMFYMDKISENSKITKNPPLISALQNFYEQRFDWIDQNIISPYAEGLRNFPEYLSQLFMESLGKDRDISGKRIYNKTGQFFLGDRGISCQHSFYQMLHNGTASVNIEFVAFGDKPALLGNCLAQSIALYSRNKENVHRKVVNKILYFDTYNPFNIGQLVSFYENKVMFLGFFYHINCYDQPGVEFGKKLYLELEDSKNPELETLSALLKEPSKNTDTVLSVKQGE